MPTNGGKKLFSPTRDTVRVYLYVTHTSSIIPTKTMQPILEIEAIRYRDTCCPKLCSSTDTVRTSDRRGILDQVCPPSVHSPSVSGPEPSSSPVLLQPDILSQRQQTFTFTSYPSRNLHASLPIRTVLLLIVTPPARLRNNKSRSSYSVELKELRKRRFGIDP